MNTNKFQYWPSNGQLGSTKFTMPTNPEDWPSGDALIGNFVYNEGKLVDFIDIKGLTPNTSKSTTIPYDYVNIELPFAEDAMTINRGPRNKYLIIKFNDKEVEEGGNVIVTLKYKNCKTVDDVKAVDPNYLTTDIVDGVWSEGLGDLEQGTNGKYNDGMFYKCATLTSFTSDLSNLTNGNNMFYNCSNLTSFTADLSSLTKGLSMFYNCTNLTSFSSDLPSLTYGTEMFRDCINLTSFSSDSSGSPVNLSSLKGGTEMFYRCSNLTSFSSDLRSLTDGGSMFWGCINLNSFSSDLSKLTKGGSMFQYCRNLNSFTSDLSSLTKGKYMFSDCSNLTSFSSDLHSLTDGSYMFDECKLDAPSVKNIIDTINTYSDLLALGIGCDTAKKDKDLFAQEVGYTDMTSLLAALKAKGWTVRAQYNGRPTTTYGLRRPSEDTLPVFAKLEETEDHATHTSEDGSKKYRLNWFHETTGSTEGYTQFNSLEEAVAYFNIKPIER